MENNQLCNPSPIILCATQRSGTTVLTRTLAQSRLIDSFEEVFEEDNSLGFFDFKKDLLLKGNLSLLYPDAANQSKIFDLYFKFLASSASKKHFILDIKYNSWHHFNTLWQGIMERPFLLKLLLKQNAKFIHLVRKNVFEQYVSYAYARATKRWHYAQRDLLVKEQIKIDVAHCEKRMRHSLNSSKLFRAWLSGANALELYYEDLFVDGLFSEVILSKIEQHIGGELALSTAQPVLKKAVSSIKDIVGNRKEVVSYFRGTEFEEYIYPLL